MTDDKKARKEEIESHGESLAAVIEQQKEYARLMTMDLIAASFLVGVAYFNFSTFEANVLLGVAVYLLFNAHKRRGYHRVVKMLREQLYNELVVLLMAWKRDHE